MDVGIALAGAFVDELGIEAVPRHGVMLRWTSSVVGMNQNGMSTTTAGTATRTIIRPTAPLPSSRRAKTTL
jgi:hypothetical protein